MASRSTSSWDDQQGQTNLPTKRIPRKGNRRPKKLSGIRHTVANFVLDVCKLILSRDSSVKAGFYLVAVAVGSIISEQFEIPQFYLSDKRNVLNQYFAKLGWGWTLTVLSPYLALTSWVYCCGRWVALRRHLMRLGVATAQWYLCVRTFRYIEDVTGYCTADEYTDRRSCLKSEQTWLGFDISGHVFLLIHNLLTITEETKTFHEWPELKVLLSDTDMQKRRKFKLTEQDTTKAENYYHALSPYIKVSFVTSALLSVLWDFMLMITILYRFHNLHQKICASFVAVACWFFSYKVFYNSNVKWLPCQPGNTVFFS